MNYIKHSETLFTILNEKGHMDALELIADGHVSCPIDEFHYPIEPLPVDCTYPIVVIYNACDERSYIEYEIIDVVITPKVTQTSGYKQHTKFLYTVYDCDGLKDAYIHFRDLHYAIDPWCSHWEVGTIYPSVVIFEFDDDRDIVNWVGDNTIQIIDTPIIAEIN